MFLRTLFFGLAFFAFAIAPAQNTIGLRIYDPANTTEGYNLMFPHKQKDVFLLDNCGRVLHQWQDDIYGPGNSVILRSDGKLLKTGSRGPIANNVIQAGGAGEVVQIKSWDNLELWKFVYNDSMVRMHHDIADLPNGNVLIIAWERILKAEVIAAGRDSSMIPGDEVWPEHIIEVHPGLDFGDSTWIVWEWHAWDHLVQDFDSTRANFGMVADHPELIDVNFGIMFQNPDWQHCNSIDYHEGLDQIVLSMPTFNEFWIIDHSTTTAEAAGHTGGNSGKGGDLLYRWGNPRAYGKGTTADQQLAFQHDVQWIAAHLDPAHPDYGKILIFNNRIGVNSSKLTQVITPVDSLGNYTLSPGQAYGPAAPDWEYEAPNPTDFFSNGLGGVQRLPNGHTLVCSGREGRNFEIDTTGTIVWEYENPFIQGVPGTQGDSVPLNGNILFRFDRYPTDFPAFNGKDLTPTGYIEINPDTSLCPSGALAIDDALEIPSISIFPNPASQQLRIVSALSKPVSLRVLNAMGQLVASISPFRGETKLFVGDWPRGVYYLLPEQGTAQKLILE